MAICVNFSFLTDGTGEESLPGTVPLPHLHALWRALWHRTDRSHVLRQSSVVFLMSASCLLCALPRLLLRLLKGMSNCCSR